MGSLRKVTKRERNGHVVIRNSESTTTLKTNKRDTSGEIVKVTPSCTSFHEDHDSRRAHFCAYKLQPNSINH